MRHHCVADVRAVIDKGLHQANAAAAAPACSPAPKRHRLLGDSSDEELFASALQINRLNRTSAVTPPPSIAPQASHVHIKPASKVCARKSASQLVLAPSQAMSAQAAWRGARRSATTAAPAAARKSIAKRLRPDDQETQGQQHVCAPAQPRPCSASAPLGANAGQTLSTRSDGCLPLSSAVQTHGAATAPAHVDGAALAGVRAECICVDEDEDADPEAVVCSAANNAARRAKCSHATAAQPAAALQRSGASAAPAAGALLLSLARAPAAADAMTSIQVLDLTISLRNA